MKQFYTMSAADKAGEILIYDQIGEDFWTGEGVTGKSFANDLKALGDVRTLSVRINSPGGNHVDAIAIYSAINRHPAKVTVHVDGIAASAAATIAMAGDEIHIAENAMMMIHNPMTMAAGDAREMRKTAELLDQVKATLVATYSNRSGSTPQDVATWMDDETWMDGPEAKARGFATVVTPAKRIDNCFDLTRFARGAEAARRLDIANSHRLCDRLARSARRFSAA